MKKIENVGWSIGNYCNAKCNHCYSWKQRKGNEDFLTYSEVDCIINKLIAYGIKTINFGGNEPIYTDGPNVKNSKLPYIIRRFHDANVLCGITTNGFTAKYLYENYRDEFFMVNDWDFSLDSPCKELHDKNRGVNGLFNMVIESMQICHRYGRPCSIVCAGMKSNLDEDSLKKYLNLAKNNNAALRINILKPTEPKHFELMPSYTEVYNAFSYLLKNTKLVTLSESVFACQLGIETHGCPCGIYSFRIKSKKNGRVSVTPCVYLDIDGGDILTQSIEDLINSEAFQKIIQRNLCLPSDCKKENCKYLESCRGGCTASTLLMTGDLNSKSPFCPLNSDYENVFEQTLKNIEHSKEENVRVHENYLCTWIGEDLD